MSAAGRAMEGRMRGGETTSRRAAIARKALALAVLHYRDGQGTAIARSLELGRKMLLSLLQGRSSDQVDYRIIENAASQLNSEMERLYKSRPAKLTTPDLRRYAMVDFGGHPEAAFLAELAKP